MKTKWYVGWLWIQHVDFLFSVELGQVSLKKGRKHTQNFRIDSSKTKAVGFLTILADKSSLPLVKSS